MSTLTSGDEAAGRVRAWRNAWMANVKDNHVIMAWLGRASARDAPDDCPELTIADIDALLAEREQLRERAETAEAALETLRGQLGKPKTQHRAVSLQLGTIVKLNTDDLRRRDEWIEGTRHEVRDVYRTPWREAQDNDWMTTGGVTTADSAPILNDGCTFPVPLNRPASDNPPTITITTYEPTPETHDRMRHALLGYYMRTSRGESKWRGKP